MEEGSGDGRQAAVQGLTCSASCTSVWKLSSTRGMNPLRSSSCGSRADGKVQAGESVGAVAGGKSSGASGPHCRRAQLCPSRRWPQPPAGRVLTSSCCSCCCSVSKSAGRMDSSAMAAGAVWAKGEAGWRVEGRISSSWLKMCQASRAPPLTFHLLHYCGCLPSHHLVSCCTAAAPGGSRGS